MTDQINRDRGDAYQAYSLPCDLKTVIKQFENRYGYTPKERKLFKKYLMLGPIVEDEHE